MRERDFREAMDTCLEKSGNDLQNYLARFETDPIAVSLLSGEEFDDIGIGRRTARSVAQEVYDFEDTEGSLTESLEQFDLTDADGFPIDQLFLDLVMLNDKSGGDQKDFLEKLFNDYAYPSVVSYAVLSDQSLGFGESTLAKAFCVKDSLPFYDTVSDILRDREPRTAPEVGHAFDPMLAVPESRGRPNNPVAQTKVDGYRLIIHLERGEPTAFSRSKNDVTESLPELEEIDWPKTDAILDAEVIAENGSYSDTSKRVGRSAENVERDVEMTFKVFDILCHGDMAFWKQSFEVRHTAARAYVTMVSDERVEVLPVSEDIEEAKDEAIDAGKEGIMVKDWEAPYKFGKRSSYWQKVKMDANRVDVRISGFEAAEGDKSGTLGAVALESADGTHVGKSGSGFSDAQRENIWNNQDDWKGRTIEVEARGVGSQGNLRMPIFKRDRSQDGEPDNYERICEIMKEI